MFSLFVCLFVYIYIQLQKNFRFRIINDINKQRYCFCDVFQFASCLRFVCLYVSLLVFFLIQFSLLACLYICLPLVLFFKCITFIGIRKIQISISNFKSTPCPVGSGLHPMMHWAFGSAIHRFSSLFEYFFFPPNTTELQQSLGSTHRMHNNTQWHDCDRKPWNWLTKASFQLSSVVKTLNCWLAHRSEGQRRAVGDVLISRRG